MNSEKGLNVRELYEKLGEIIEDGKGNYDVTMETPLFSNKGYVKEIDVNGMYIKLK